MSRRAYWLVVAPLLALALQGCGGGGGSSSTDDPDSDSGATATVSEDNALSVAQEGTRTISSTGGDGGDFTAFANTLPSSSDSSTATAGGADFTTQATETCDNGGTLEYDVLSDNTSENTTIEYIATDCELDGETLDGTFELTVGTWEEFSPEGIESLFETRDGPFTTTDCSFEGGFGFRVYYDMPETLPGGDYEFVFEYGTTADRDFSASCPDHSYSLAADTSVRNRLEYTLDDNGDLVGSVYNVVTAGGSFESPDDDGTLVFSTTDLEFPVDDNNESEFGDVACPSGGSFTITGADDNEVTVYFGDDAGDSYEVQVMGPNGYLAEYETCSEFLSSSDAQGAAGDELWSFVTGDSVFSSPVLGDDGTVYVGSADNKVYALNPDGSEKWSFETGSDVESSPALGDDGTVYAGSVDNTVYALNPDGSEKWSFATGNSVFSSPVLGDDGTVYVSSGDTNVYALNPDDGSEKWSFATGGWIDSSPVLGADGTVYVGSNDNKVYAINPDDGSEKWSFATGDWVYSSPAVGADGTVYVGSNDKKVYALNPDDGTEKWSFLTGGWVRSSPALG
ncbi:MAG: PQQ-binding-like beta-propeller repeat protein, partial [Thiohalophilus sp.]